MAAFIAPVTPAMDIVSVVISSAEDHDIRHGRADQDGAAAARIHIAHTPGNNEK